MESLPYVRLIKRWWWTLLIATWIAGLAGFTVASGLPPTYETQVRLLIGPLSADLNTQRAAGQNAQTYAELATSQQLLDTVVEKMGGSITTPQLRETVEARADSTTRLLTLTARAPDPDTAVEIANTLASRIAALPGSPQAGAALPEGEITIVDPAARPGTPVAPDVALIVVLAAAAGLLGAAAIVFLIEYVTDVVRDRYDIADVSPVLGIVPSFRSRSSADMASRVANLARHPGVSISLRYLTAMLAVADGTLPKRLLVVGTRAGDGAGAFAASLAITIVDGGRTVTLVDANGHEREISDLMDIDMRSGSLKSVLVGRTRSVQPMDHRLPGLTVLPYGASEPLVDVTDADAATGLLDGLADGSDVVLVNAPSPDRSPSALTWARSVDATLVVVHADFATRRHMTSLIDDLERVGAKAVGIVMSQGKPGPAPRLARRSRAAGQAPSTRGGRLGTLIQRLRSGGTTGRRARSRRVRS